MRVFSTTVACEQAVLGVGDGGGGGVPFYPVLLHLHSQGSLPCRLVESWDFVSILVWTQIIFVFPKLIVEISGPFASQLLYQFNPKFSF